MNHVDKDFDNSREFTIERNRLLVAYKAKERKTTLKEKKQVVKKTFQCVKNSRTVRNLKKCQDFEKINLEKIYLAFNDNPKLKNLVDKDELINRYEIRVEMAKLDNEDEKVNVFSKTLECFKRSRSKRDIYSCKKNEKNRIIELLRS